MRSQPILRLAATVLIGAICVAVAEAQPAKASSIPRMADGRPDMQGIWTHGTLTPFERDAALGMKAFYDSDEEMARAADQILARQAAIFKRPGFVGSDNEAFMDTGYTMLATRQTSLLVDPPDGRLPVLPEALTRSAFYKENRDDMETMSSWDRCLSRGPAVLLPAGYNNGTRIVQTPGYVAIESESVHEARIIPTARRPHLPPSVRNWLGDPVGWWEGDTFVVDSTNYHGKGWLATDGASGRLRGLPYSERLHIVERFTLRDARTIAYEMTLEDPAVFSRPWTVSYPLYRHDGYVMYEAACHEGNRAIELVLRGARFEERHPTPKPVP
ncbi:MAG: hypothetical protein AB7N65_24165 [Vicinamibacterales bacterium]